MNMIFSQWDQDTLREAMRAEAKRLSHMQGGRAHNVNRNGGRRVNPNSQRGRTLAAMALDVEYTAADIAAATGLKIKAAQSVLSQLSFDGKIDRVNPMGEVPGRYVRLA